MTKSVQELKAEWQKQVEKEKQTIDALLQLKKVAQDAVLEKQKAVREALLEIKKQTVNLRSGYLSFQIIVHDYPKDDQYGYLRIEDTRTGEFLCINLDHMRDIAAFMNNVASHIEGKKPQYILEKEEIKK